MPALVPPSASSPVSCTVVIVTKDRRDELRTALASAVVQRHPQLEVLVVDDGSADGTCGMVRTEFPEVRVERFARSEGLVRRRNEAARLATGDVIVSLDDDAVFSSRDIVSQTLDDLDHPSLGAVAMPYYDVGRSIEELQRAPEPHGRWVTATFRGTAYAVRRELFLGLGGYREAIVHQGEELDFTMRMLDAGYFVRLGRADPIHHRESPKRDLRRVDVYGRRNEVLFCTTYLPGPYALVAAAAYALVGFLRGVRVGRGRNMLAGIREGVRVSIDLRSERRPVRWSTARARRRLRAAGALPLDHVERELHRSV